MKIKERIIYFGMIILILVAGTYLWRTFQRIGNGTDSNGVFASESNRESEKEQLLFLHSILTVHHEF